MKIQKKAVVLLSGGLDSSTVLYYAKKQGFSCQCLIFDYGQRHRKEIRSALKIARKAGSKATVIRFKFPLKDSSLLDRSRKLPVNLNPLEQKGLPSTYVPGRNTVFLSFALSFAETIQASAIFVGANAIDFSGYPDCRPVYYKAWQKLINSLGMKIKIVAPLLYLDKKQIVELGKSLKVPLEHTWSCYEGAKYPCGVCDSCSFRQKGFSSAGYTDPALIQ